MKRPFLSALFLVLCFVWPLTARAAAAQDLFELEVFEYESTPPGEYEVAFHTNAMMRGGTVPGSAAANHRPVHLSIEVTRGWSDRIETAFFVQTAPFGSTESARFAGGHVRTKIRVGTIPGLSLRVAASAEYAFNRAAFDHELQTFETRGILDFARGRLSVIANPSLEIVTRGSDEGLAPLFDLSARAVWRLTERVALAADYYSAAATLRHLPPESDAHHLVFAGIDLVLSGRWEIGISGGHCVTQREPWLMKSVLGYSF
jgi:hypothetical protein